MIRHWTWLAALGLLSLGLTACGDSGDDDDDVVEVDAGTDGGIDDGGPRPDRPPVTQCWGEPCTDELRDCSGRANSRACFEEQPPLTFGGAERPIVDTNYDPLPSGTVEFTQIGFPDGMCVGVPTSAAADDCATDAECTIGGGCFGRCLTYTNAGDRACFLACDPAAADNGPCRDGYSCDLGIGVCLTGCVSDDQCKTSLEDTNGNGQLDPFDFAENRSGDRWVYDATSAAVCNPDTFRCDNPGVAGVTAGDPCQRDSQCMEDGSCFPEAAGFPGGGYCVKEACNLAGRACDTGDTCQGKGFGDTPACLEACTFGAESGTDDEIGPGGNGVGCREGYKCEWNGRVDPATGRPLTGGACLPGNYNDVTENNVGNFCRTNADCYSLFGAGTCVTREYDGMTGADTGFCILRDCKAEGDGASAPNPLSETAYCGTGNECINAGGAGTGSLENPSEYWCVQGCSTGDQCADAGFTITVAGEQKRVNFACNDSFTVGATDGFCWHACNRGNMLDSSMCPVGFSCQAVGTASGTQALCVED